MTLQKISIIETHPLVFAEWHPTKNTISPESLTKGSQKKVWWICKEGHEWEALVYNRTMGKGCPICNRPILRREPLSNRLLKEWIYEKNIGVKPHHYTTGSDYVAWWKCEKGHEWQTKIEHRRHSGCPYCITENRNIPLNETLLEEWHPNKNEGLNPLDYTMGSNVKVWWVCKQGHEWEARIDYKTGCRECHRMENSLPETLLTEWHPTKNERMNPLNFTKGSKVKIWWRCKNGHECETRICTRIKNGCDKCRDKKRKNRTRTRSLLPMSNRRTENNKLPEILIIDWHPTKNELTPFDVTKGSKRKIWWKCKQGHEWQAPIVKRANGTGCKICRNQEKSQLGSKKNGIEWDSEVLARLNTEWNFLKNGQVQLENLAPTSTKIYWWKCNNGHEWQTALVYRFRHHKKGCKFCKKSKDPSKTDSTH